MKRAALLLSTIGCVAGTGEIPIGPGLEEGRVEINPSPVDFPSLLLGHQFEQTVRLINHTEQQQRVSWTLDPGVFSIDGDGDLELAPGEEKHLIILFVPPSLGIFEDVIQFRCAGGCGDVPIIGAAYDGVDLDNPVGCFGVDLYAEVGTCTRAEMTCTNGATTDVVVTDFETHAPWSALKLLSPLPVTMPARATMTFEIEFCPPAQGSWGNCVDYTVNAVDERQYLAHVSISAETPCYCPNDPPPTGIDCGGLPEPWVIGPAVEGSSAWFGAYCQAAGGEPITRIEVVPPVAGVSLSDMVTNHFTVSYDAERSGRIETTLVLESANASRTIPLVLIGE